MCENIFLQSSGEREPRKIFTPQRIQATPGPATARILREKIAESLSWFSQKCFVEREIRGKLRKILSASIRRFFDTKR